MVQRASATPPRGDEAGKLPLTTMTSGVLVPSKAQVNVTVAPGFDYSGTFRVCVRCVTDSFWGAHWRGPELPIISFHHTTRERDQTKKPSIRRISPFSKRATS